MTATAAITGSRVHPVLHITSTTLSPKVFYPLVRDGFRDFATYRFTLNEAASGSVQIFNAKGKLTRSFPFTGRDHFSVAWGGANRFGGRVKPGFYRFRVTAHLPGRRATSGYLREQVKTDFRLRFVLPRGAKVTLLTHVVRAGITPCRHKVWTTSHTGRIHRATFTHGSLNNFSQCDIGRLSLRYGVTHKIRI